MRKDSLARIFAHALFQVASREGQVGPWGDQLRRLRGILTGSGSLRIFLASPNIPAAARRKLIGRISSREGLAPQMENFLHLIVRKKAGGQVERISEIYSGLADELFNRLNLTVESAVPMGREGQERLEKILRAGWNKTILVDYRIRPDLIAGLVLKAGERVYDLSLRGQLIRMKGRLLS